MKTKNRTKIYEKYKGLWVALKQDDTVVGSGKTLKDALDEAKKNGEASPVMTRVPEKNVTFVGGVWL